MATTLSWKLWVNYINKLSAIDKTAGLKMKQLLNMGGLPQTSEAAKQVVDYANGLVMKYGEASAALAAEMYDAIALMEKANVPAAVPAAVPEYGEVASAVNGTIKTGNVNVIVSAVERLVKQPAAETMVRNAARDRAEYAWVPNGDTCAYCIALASRGWETASYSDVSNMHIHANCDCTYAVRHNKSTSVSGYDPDKYKKIYDNAPRDLWNTPDGKPSPEFSKETLSQQKINALRREFYEENKKRINEQKRSAYAKRKELNSSRAEELKVN